MDKNLNVIVNIACDAFEDAVITKTDGNVEFYEEMMEKYISRIFDQTPVGRVFYNVNYKRSCVLSETADTYLYNIKRGKDGLPVLDENGKAVKEYLPADKIPFLNGKFRKMQEKDIDIIQMALNSTKSRGIECWFSFRMNDHHLPDDPTFNSSFHYDNAKELGVCGSNVFIDYTKEPVRNYYKNYIKELCETYEVDGIELDFLRSCPIMSEVSTANVEIINNFVRELKTMINGIAKKKGSSIQTAARVYCDIARNESYGLDPVKWVSEGLIDLLILENWFVPTHFDIPVKKWREQIEHKNIKNHKYSIYCGTDFAVRCGGDDYHTREMNISLEQHKGFVSASYQNGADGIYFFNHFKICGEDEAYFSGLANNLTYYIDDGGNKICKEVLRDKFCLANSQQEAETGEREYVLTPTFGDKPVCPMIVEDWIPCCFEINTGTAVKFGHYTVLLGVDSDDDLLSVSVNGNIAKQISDMPKAKDFVWKENERPIELGQHVSEMAYRIMRFTVTDLSVIKDGYNKIIITDKNGTSHYIRWISVQVDGE